MTTTVEQPRRPWQFSLKRALLWTLQLCVLLAVIRYTRGFPLVPVALVATWFGSKLGAPAAILAASATCGLAAMVVSAFADSLAIAAFWFIGGAFFGALFGLFIGLPIVIARHHWTRRFHENASC
jgi:hypothetical protein